MVPLRTTSTVGANSKCLFAVGLGRNNPVVPSAAFTVIRTIPLVLVCNLTVFARRTVAAHSPGRLQQGRHPVALEGDDHLLVEVIQVLELAPPEV
jgi:hypothetical protein